MENFQNEMCIPFAMITAKMGEQEGAIGEALSFASTHPASRDRADAIKQLVAERGRPDVRPLKSDWAHIKTLCTPQKVTTPDSR